MSDSGSVKNTLRMRTAARYFGYAALLFALITLMGFVREGEILTAPFAATWICLVIAFILRSRSSAKDPANSESEAGDDT